MSRLRGVTIKEIIDAENGTTWAADSTTGIEHWCVWVRVRGLRTPDGDLGPVALVCVDSNNPELVGGTVSLPTLERGIPREETLRRWRRLPPVADTAAAATAEATG